MLNPFPPKHHQSGATLVVALLILVLIMMIGIAAVSTSDTQYKLAGNLQFEDVAMNNAEAAVNEAENRFAAGALRYDDGGFTTRQDGPLYPMTSTVDIYNMQWDATSSPTSAMVSENPRQRYIIRMMSQNNRLQGSSQAVGGRSSTGCNQVNTYEITGRGEGVRGALKYVQTVYSVLSCPT